MFRSKERVENDVLILNNPFRKLIHFLVSFEKDAVPVIEVKKKLSIDAFFGATDKRAPIAGGIIHHGAKLLELLQWDGSHHSALVEPNLFQSSK
jgi:hypothetical protein